MKEVSLSSAMSSNLLALQRVSGLMNRTQERLATGLRINSALDNPSSYYTAVSLNNRAGDLGSLLDSMSQSIQTIKAANEGIEAATTILSQMKAVAEQAATAPSVSAADIQKKVDIPVRDLSEFVAEGYQVITSDMDTETIQSMIDDYGEGAKFVLADDITLDGPLGIGYNDVTIDGNGHTMRLIDDEGMGAALVIAGSDAVVRNINLEYTCNLGYFSSAVWVDGEGLTADISNVNITAKGDYVNGITVSNGGSVKIDTISGIQVDGKGAQRVYDDAVITKALLADRNSSAYNGRANTKALLAELGADALAATAANKFYVGNKTDANFGQGKWYLPAIGELAEAYGIDMSQVQGAYWGTEGATSENKDKINAALSTLKGKGAEAEALTNGYYWSSSESNCNYSWILYMINGTRYIYNKNNFSFVRCFQLLENCFNPSTLSAEGGSESGAAAPKIGDVMYSDLSYGSANDYDNNDTSKKAVGVVTWVSEDGKSAKIMNLKDLRFSSRGDVNNFNPDKPYEDAGHTKYCQQTTDEKWTQDIKGITNFMGSLTGGITVEDENERYFSAQTYANQFNDLLEQYDKLVKDSSYKGINLLQGNALKVMFNEHSTSSVNVQGQNVSSSELGLNIADWKELGDIVVSAEELGRAIASLRDLSSEMGNYYSIVQNRQDFTQTLINVLTEGADNLTLADMNEESANMLALQTRQQLGVSALQLSSEAARGVLDLF